MLSRARGGRAAAVSSHNRVTYNSRSAHPGRAAADASRARRCGHPRRRESGQPRQRCRAGVPNSLISVAPGAKKRSAIWVFIVALQVALSRLNVAVAAPVRRGRHHDHRNQPTSVDDSQRVTSDTAAPARATPAITSASNTSVPDGPSCTSPRRPCRRAPGSPPSAARSPGWPPRTPPACDDAGPRTVRCAPAAPGRDRAKVAAPGMHLAIERVSGYRFDAY